MLGVGHCEGRDVAATGWKDKIISTILYYATLAPIVVCRCRDVGYRGFWFFPWLESKSQEQQQAVVAKTLRLMADGTMAPPVGECKDSVS